MMLIVDTFMFCWYRSAQKYSRFHVWQLNDGTEEKGSSVFEKFL